ncbi:MAG: ABC transporter permease [Anaerolineaceae bacterium]|nr:ABC transporter permease [Anaerolineaceae bacterium]
MTTSFIEGVLTGSIQSSTSVLYAALGEVIVERAGVINLGVEGSMLMGAVSGFMVAKETGSAGFGVVVGALVAGLFNLILAYLVVTRKANQLASGLALMFCGLGLSALIGKPYVGQMINGLDPLPIPVLSQIPVIGRILFNHDILIYLMLPLALLVWWVLFNTRWGLSLRAVGEDPTVAFAAGLRPKLIQYQAVFIGGLFAGLGGAHLSLAYAQIWNEGMTSGRGFIAVALVIFASWHPLKAVAGALLFGGALAFQLQLQARGAEISPFLLDMIPYLLTLGVLLFMRNRKNAMPEGLKAVFEGTS